jgi:hypothetical protein
VEFVAEGESAVRTLALRLHLLVSTKTGASGSTNSQGATSVSHPDLIA